MSGQCRFFHVFTVLMGLGLSLSLVQVQIAQAQMVQYGYYIYTPDPPKVPIPPKYDDFTSLKEYRQYQICQALQPVSQYKSPNQITQEVLRANNLPDNLVNQVNIVSSDQLNAWTDGANIYITQPLWNALATNDQRAFIISHELSHVVLNHIEKTQLRQTGLSLLDAYLLDRFYKSGSWWDVAENFGLGLVDKRFSRNEEYQADDLGIGLMAQTGYNPQAAVQVLDFFQQRTGRNLTPEFMRDHPMDAARIQALVQKYQLSRQG